MTRQNIPTLALPRSGSRKKTFLRVLSKTYLSQPDYFPAPPDTIQLIALIITNCFGISNKKFLKINEQMFAFYFPFDII